MCILRLQYKRLNMDYMKLTQENKFKLAVIFEHNAFKKVI